MKQILLRISTVFSEVRFRELPQPLRGHFLSTREIMLPQHALDPDIDRECSQPLIRKKHHAICNLRPHAWQRAKLFSELGVRRCRPGFEIRLAGTDEPRRRTQIFGAIAELAIAQLLLGSLRNSPRRSERVHELIPDSPLLAKSFSERQRNLANMRHLFHRRTNECGETFPFRLPDDPEPATKITCSVHHWIL